MILQALTSRGKNSQASTIGTKCCEIMEFELSTLLSSNLRIDCCSCEAFSHSTELLFKSPRTIAFGKKCLGSVRHRKKVREKNSNNASMHNHLPLSAAASAGNELGIDSLLSSL